MSSTCSTRRRARVPPRAQRFRQRRRACFTRVRAARARCACVLRVRVARACCACVLRVCAIFVCAQSNYHLGAALSDSDSDAPGLEPPALFARFQSWVADMTAEDQAMLFEGSAAAFYRL